MAKRRNLDEKLDMIYANKDLTVSQLSDKLKISTNSIYATLNEDLYLKNIILNNNIVLNYANENQNLTIQEIADNLELSYTTVFNNLKKDKKLKEKLVKHIKKHQEDI